MKKISVVLLLTVISIFGWHCAYDPVTMPETTDSSQVFKPGEEKYISLNPTWNGDTRDFDQPRDIYISIDDYIFVADSGNKRIVVLNKTGRPIQTDNFGNDFSILDSIPSARSESKIAPVALTLDSKLNLFVLDRSKYIYCWNQFINNIHNRYTGQDSIAAEIIYENTTIGDRKQVTPADFAQSKVLEQNGYRIDEVLWKYRPQLIDSILAPHVFYQEDRLGDAAFVGIAAAPFGNNSIYVTDQLNQRITRIDLVRSQYLKLKDGTTLWQHKGVFVSNIANAGTGAGTVNNPAGIVVDQEGNLLYTQSGKNFGVHKIRQISAEYQSWTSVFALGENEIMDLDRFTSPADVAIDDQGNIFVLNTGRNEIQQFNDRGQFIRKAGLREVQVDTTVIDTLISSGDTTFTETDTIMTKYYHDMLNNPQSISIDDGVIYVVNTGNNEIIRFKLSTDIDIELPE